MTTKHTRALALVVLAVLAVCLSWLAYQEGLLAALGSPGSALWASICRDKMWSLGVAGLVIMLLAYIDQRRKGRAGERREAPGAPVPLDDPHVAVVQPPAESVPAARTPAPLPPQPYFAHPYPLQRNFTGRVRERRMLTEWLAGRNRRVLTLVAMGGMGKSALAWAWLLRDVLGLPLPGEPEENPETAKACRVPEDARPDGILWWSFYEREASFGSFVERALRYCSGGELDPATIPSAHDKVEALVRCLQEKRLLLVLDGFERELRAYASMSAAYQGEALARRTGRDDRTCTDPHAGMFLRLVAALPLRSRVLITSRLFPYELEQAAGVRDEELRGFDPADAVAFFRAQGIRKGTRAEIEAECAPYGYLPLALRLLAGMIAGDKKKPGDIAVAKRHRVLPELRGKEQHHILEASYEALDRHKRRLLSRIAAFRSPMPYEALAAVNPYRKAEPLDAALAELVERGLLLFDRGAARYDLHPIVRQYAYDRLTDKEGVHSRLQDYFAAVPKPGVREVGSLDDLSEVIELYHHTVRAGRFDDAFGLFRDRLSEALYYRLGAYQACIELLSALFPEGHPFAPDGQAVLPRLEDESAQAWVLNNLANSYSLSGHPRLAAPLVEAQNAIQERRDDKLNLAIGLGNLAYMALMALGELAAAEGALRRSVELCGEIGDELWEAVGRMELGSLLAHRGAFPESAEELNAAFETFEGRGDAQGQSVVSAHRALHGLLMGEPEGALAAARQARAFADETARTRYPYESDFVRAEWLIGASLVALADADESKRAEKLDEAERHLRDALRRCRRINLVESEPDILLAWAKWHRLKGDARAARRDAEEALHIADRCEYRLCQADIHNFLARLALDEGDRESALEQAETAKERALCDGPPHCYKPALDEAERMLTRRR